MRGGRAAADSAARSAKPSPRTGAGDIVIVAHGGVGTLLLCSLLERPITRALDQPGQGHFFASDRDQRHVLHHRRPLDDLAAGSR